MAQTLLIYFFILSFPSALSLVDEDLKRAIADKKVDVQYFKNSVLLYQREKDFIAKTELAIYCDSGNSKKTLGRIFSSAAVNIGNTGDDYTLFKGNNESHVYQQYTDTRQSWFQLIPWRTQSVNFAVFDQTCLGISSKSPYSVKFIRKLLDPWLVSFFVAGISLFFLAGILSKNILFYYGCGVSIGLLASLLIVVFIVSRFIPKKYGLAYAALLGGGSLTLYFLQYVWENLTTVLQQHQAYVVGYFTAAGMVSFGYCYYRGPVTSARTLNLIKWSIQLAALSAVYYSVQVTEVAVIVISTVILVHNFPTTIWKWLLYKWSIWFPSKPKLLSEEEYQRQGSEETKKALEELRSFCRSPECDAWKTISRLGSPTKFAKFVEGDSHVTDDEALGYDSDHLATRLPAYDTDNESEISFSLNSQ